MNRKLAEKDPGLREGDTVLRINGQSVEGITIEEATKWLSKSREKLSLVVQRDVRRDSSRWPSQNTVYERLGSVSGTPRHSPSPMQPSIHQAVAPRSSLEYANTSTTSNTRWSQSEQQSLDYGDFYRRNGSIASSQGGQSESNVRVVRFRKIGGSLGVRVIGGNQVGIFVSAVQDDSPAALHSIRPGDRILSVNDKPMIGVTREEAVRHLLSLQDDVTIKVEYVAAEFDRIRSGQLGDSFYIRTHFAHQKSSNQLELSFHNGDIFHITDTLFGGTVGFWQATRVYSAAENGTYTQSDNNKGVIPNAETYYSAETLAKAARADTSTFGRSTFFRRKLKERRTKSLSKNVIDDVTFENACDMAFPAYERVTLRHPHFQRPLVLYGPLADVARHLLLTNFALRFATVLEENIVRLSSIDAVIASNKHCVLEVSPGSVERLQLAQYAPIVIFIDVESRNRIRDLRNQAGAPQLSTKKLIEQAHKIKKHYSHLLTVAATLDATKEDGWFEALLQLIAHLQDRRVWMPEFRPQTNLNDVILLPMHGFQNQSDSDVDSLKGEYSTSEYITRSQLHLEKEQNQKPFCDHQNATFGGQYPRPLRPGRSHPADYIGGSMMMPPGIAFYQNVHPCEQISRYSSRMQLSPANNNPSQQHLSPLHRNCFFDYPPSCSTNQIPWATLPRRHNNNPVNPESHLSFNAHAPPNSNQQRQRLTAPNGMPVVPQTAHSPRHQVHEPASPRLPHRSPKKRISSRASPSSLIEPDAGITPVTVSSSLAGTSNSITDANRQTNQNSSATGLYDVKQILADHSEYYPSGASKDITSSQYENADSSSFNGKNGQMYSQEISRNRIFQDSPARNHWTNSTPKKPSLTPEGVHSRVHPRSAGDSKPKNTPSDELTYIDAQNLTTFSNASADLLTRTQRLEVNDTNEQMKKALNSVESTSNCDATVIEHASAVISNKGGTISCPETGVSLIVPEGAISDGVQQEIYVKVCRANGSGGHPPLDESRGESLTSPLVMCGPQDLRFNVPVELRLPHSVSNNGEKWSLALKSRTGQHWDQVPLNKDDASSIVTDRFVSIKIHHF